MRTGNLETHELTISKFRAILLSLRPYQWSKNLLVFVPWIAAHRFWDIHALALSMIAFAVFSAIASASYLINDLIDLPVDRLHRHKRLRPIAAGAVPIACCKFLVFGLMALGLSVGSFMGKRFLAVILSYFLISLIYSVFLKRIAVLDVFVLAVLYTARIVAGHEATGIRYSHWLLAFAVSFFLSLACMKRYTEILYCIREKIEQIPGRSYSVSDQVWVRILGTCSGYLAVHVLILYLNSSDVYALYSSPKILWAASFILLFWIHRIWFLAKSGLIKRDPILFALTDRLSYLLVVLILATGALAMTEF